MTPKAADVPGGEPDQGACFSVPKMEAMSSELVGQAKVAF